MINKNIIAFFFFEYSIIPFNNAVNKKILSRVHSNYAIWSGREAKISGKQFPYNRSQVNKSFYFMLHIINHIQLASLIIEAHHDTQWFDFKMRYTSTFAAYTLINKLLSSSMTKMLANFMIYLFFLSQMLLVIILSVTTVVRLTINS